MSTPIDTAEIIRAEAAEKVLDILAAAGDVDLTGINHIGDARALANRLLDLLTEKLASAILRDAVLMDCEAEEAHAEPRSA